MDRRQTRFVSTLAVLLGVAAPARAQPGPTPEITVLGSMEALPDVLRERSLDEDSIAGFSVSSLDDLVAEIRSEMADDEDEPVYLLNGQRVRNLTDIGGLPLEAIKLVEVLPAGSSGIPGASPTARVYNIVLKSAVKTETVIAAPKAATDGAWAQFRSEGTLTRIQGEKRLNITLRAQTEDSLLESERDILQPTPRRPYDLRGNVIADPRFPGDEIDPRLSAVAGTRVTTAAVPVAANPALADFARGANTPNTTNLGAFRTGRPKSNFYEFRVNHANSLASWLSASISGRFSYTGNKSLGGLSSGLFVVTPDNQFSPFSRSVGLAKYGEPLRQNYRRLEGNVDLELKATFGEWHANLHTVHQRTQTRSSTDRQDPTQALQPIVLGTGMNPFSAGALNLIPVGLDRSRYRTRGTTVEGDIKGHPFRLPAGPVTMGLDARLTWTTLKSARSFFTTESAASLRRTERELHGTLNVPITSRANKVLAAIGDLSANFEYGRISFSDTSHADRYHYGLSWTPREGIRIDATSHHARQTPGIETLGEPITFTSGVRLLDILRGETVDVTQISGGNPSLRAERFDYNRVAANLRPIRKLNFNLNAEYIVINRHDLNSVLPRESVPIWLSFPDRFIRDEAGRLTAADFRPVNFELAHQERLRYGFSLNLPLGDAAADRPPSEPRTRSNTRLRVSANHTIFLANRLDIGPGLPSVDMLGGGAVGIVGNRPRHQVEFSVNVGKPGLGLRMTGTYRGANLLQIRGTTGGTDFLTFAPYTTLNLYAFVGGERFRETSWLKGSRLGVYVINLTNVRQRVTNGAGATPLRYQPGYRDPLGRTIEIEFRKQF